ncbi:DNA phosphorothioation-associated protein 4 [Nodosilinea sp. PGN35]|uniref:DNA phosphorothioation-associated protein 4 n=1 Tax=Nodosilinea sp. PGN35 TaxID=3020489 RepID=UPI0023B24BCE|nr:DNA phosphorothioation-associated protein 4 [Nodosilinea sp. TSF1-S3]MDF0369172.1 DNA phosphorothioation-associated protein 4 [Nodosilinea sp. TSF1-S3]
MALARVHFSEDKAELVRNLRSSDGAIGPFRTYAEIVTFAAALGFHNSRRVPLGNYSRKDPDAVLQEQIRGVELIKLIALAHTQDPEILCDDEVHDYIRVEIFEQYVNGGLEILASELSGSVDYSDQVLLMLKLKKQTQQSSTNFDLSKFL